MANYLRALPYVLSRRSGSPPYPQMRDLLFRKCTLLYVTYKNVIGARRASWRIVSSIEQNEGLRCNTEHINAIKDYRY
ncbi:hypothetical protein Leryth_010671 [Lithospermum erythrorhizon]|nr:hypothetical protein Leryth_010671 [Lithospermum erythrorhizon]